MTRMTRVKAAAIDTTRIHDSQPHTQSGRWRIAKAITVAVAVV
jgi:hypothetical protein